MYDNQYNQAKERLLSCSQDSYFQGQASKRQRAVSAFVLALTPKAKRNQSARPTRYRTQLIIQAKLPKIQLLELDLLKGLRSNIKDKFIPEPQLEGFRVRLPNRRRGLQNRLRQSFQTGEFFLQSRKCVLASRQR